MRKPLKYGMIRDYLESRYPEYVTAKEISTNIGRRCGDSTAVISGIIRTMDDVDCIKSGGKFPVNMYRLIK